MSRKSAVIAPAAIIVSVIGYLPFRNWFDIHDARIIVIDIIFATREVVFALINMKPPYPYVLSQRIGDQGWFAVFP